MRRHWIRLGCAALAIGCGEPSTTDDAGATDAPASDGGEVDGAAPTDGGGVDAPAAPSPRLLDLSAGPTSSCAVIDDGTIRCWGDNRARQLGAGSTDDESVTPLAVVGIDDAVEVEVGYELACARHEGGTVSCWGNNTNGRLGDGTEDDRETPVAVSGLTDVVDVEVGLYITCALKDDGTEWCWGRMADIGNGFEGSMVPVQVDGLSGVTAIGLSTNEGTGSSSTVSCGVRDDGSAYCWGPNNYGQLGTGDQDDSRIPIDVGVLTDVVTISPGGSHTCAITESDTFCWGFPGSVGDGNGSENRFSPVPVTSDETFVAIDAGSNHTCAVTDGGDVYCWGNCGRGQCGDGTTLGGSYSLLVPTRAVIDDVDIVTAGGAHSCAYTDAGVTYCWGDTTYGQLGSGEATSLERVNVPTAVVW